MSLPLQLLLTEFHRILLTESHHNQAITWLCLLFSISSCTSVSAKLLQSCLTLCDHMDSSPPGSSVHGILLARILEWVAMPSSRGSSCPQDRTWVFMSIALVGGFFTTSAAWEAGRWYKTSTCAEPGSQRARTKTRGVGVQKGGSQELRKLIIDTCCAGWLSKEAWGRNIHRYRD